MEFAIIAIIAGSSGAFLFTGLAFAHARKRPASWHVADGARQESRL